MVSMAAEKTVKPVPASAMSKWRTVVRKTPPQSMMAPSTRKAMQAMMPTNVTMPFGRARSLPPASPPYGSRWREAVSVTSTMTAAAIPVEARGVSENVPTQMPKSPAPAKPPTLQSACMPLMRRRPAAFSTMTAWMLTTTSMQPIVAPKISNSGMASWNEDTVQSASSSAP